MTGWRARAACAGQADLFFDGRREAKARAVCAGCPVRAECLEFALAAGVEAGVWGGLGEAGVRAAQRGGRRESFVRVSRPRGPYREKAA